MKRICVGVLMWWLVVGLVCAEEGLLVNRRRPGEEVDDFQLQGDGAWAGESSIFSQGFRLYAVCTAEELNMGTAVYKFEGIDRKARHFALLVGYQTKGPAVACVLYNEQAAGQNDSKGKILILDDDREEDTLYFEAGEHVFSDRSIEVHLMAANAIFDAEFLDLKGYGDRPVEVVERVVEKPVYRYVSSVSSWPVYYHRYWGPIYRFVGYDLWGRPIYEVSTGYWTSSAYWSWRHAVEIRISAWPVRVYHYDWSRGHRPRHRYVSPGVRVVRRLPRAVDCPRGRSDVRSRSVVATHKRVVKKPNRGRSEEGRISLEEIVARRNRERQQASQADVQRAGQKTGGLSDIVARNKTRREREALADRSQERPRETSLAPANPGEGREVIPSQVKTRGSTTTSRGGRSSQQPEKESTLSRAERALYRLAGRERPTESSSTVATSTARTRRERESSGRGSGQVRATTGTGRVDPGQRRGPAVTQVKSRPSDGRARENAGTQVSRTSIGRPTTPKKPVRAAPQTATKKEEKKTRRGTTRSTKVRSGTNGRSRGSRG